jgi:predicted nucleic acid-binding protein
MIWFVDTSALVKRYLKEQGSEWVRSEIVHHDVLISQATPIEPGAAFSKRLGDGSVSKFVFYQARKALGSTRNAAPPGRRQVRDR